MDPIGLAASIITLLEATNAVITICYNYNSFSSGTPTALLNLIDETCSLRNVLESLVRLVQEETKIGSSSPVAAGIEKLEALERQLTPSQYYKTPGRALSRRQSFLQALTWPLKEGEANRVIEQIALLRSTLSLALETDQTLVFRFTFLAQSFDIVNLILAVLTRRLMLAMQDLTVHNNNLLEDTQGRVASLQQASSNQQNESRHEKIQTWLAAPDATTNHGIALSKRHPGTGEWLVGSKEFSAWQFDASIVLWICGIPGCGKTILTSTIIDHLQNNRANAGAASSPGRRIMLTYFYFDFCDANRQDPEDMLRSVVSQLVSQCSRLDASVDDLFVAKAAGGRQSTFQGLLQILRGFMQERDEVFLVLDALDECVDKPRLWDFLREIDTWDTRLHLLITSQQDDETESQFKRLKCGIKIPIQASFVDADIRSYVRERLYSDPKLRRWQRRPDLVYEITEAMAGRANGMFRWVACQLDALVSCLNVSMLRQALSSLPRSLDGMYTDALCQIDNAHSGLVSTLLQWLTYSTRPLSVEELAEIATVDLARKSASSPTTQFDPDRRFLDPKDILSLCPSIFITTTPLNPGDSTLDDQAISNRQVRLAHFSVKQFLTSVEIQVGPASRYAVLEGRSHAAIAKACIAYLLQFERPYTVMANVVRSSPLLRYAANYWPLHARLAGDHGDGDGDADPALGSMIMELFTTETAYLNWTAFLDGYTPFSRDSIFLSSDGSDRPPHALYYASSFRLCSAAWELISNNAPINSSGPAGTALAAACLLGHVETARLLLDNGAEVDAEGPLGSPMFLAAGKGHIEVVKLLLERGADATKRNEGMTALEEATRYGHRDAVRLLSST
ncbi:hypothetical protein BJX70DRAFT_393936 [Aspergillus crustosus]